MAFYLVLYGCFRLATYISQTSCGSSIKYTFWITWCITRSLFLLCNVFINLVILVLQVIKWSISRPIHLYITSHKSLWQPFFYYQQLPPETREIRLIKVVRRSPFPAPTFTLATFPLEKAPPYDAVLYTWGGQDRDEGLFLDNDIFQRQRRMLKGFQTIVQP